MRIFAKKAFQFSQREEKDGVMVVADKVTTEPLDFQDVPDWAATDPIFEWAKADGDIEIMQSQEDIKKAELAADKQKKVK